MAPIAPDTVLRQPEFSALSDHVIDTTVLCYYREYQDKLAACLAERMSERGLSGCGSYLALLHDDEQTTCELDCLVELLTIDETFFFRHHELFDSLQTRVLPELIDRNRHSRRLRIWSAGCAVGAEPYSLSILLKREFVTDLAGWDVRIVATDINRKSLSQAQRGEFSDWTLRSVPEVVKESCFAREDRSWIINEEFRRGVSFQYHNLVQDPFSSVVNDSSTFDLILCRNVMIYFEAEVVRRLVGQFHDALGDGGWFAVGPVEPSVYLYRAFQTINSGDVVLYQKGSPVEAPGASARSEAATPVAIAQGNGTPRQSATVGPDKAPFVATHQSHTTATHGREVSRSANPRETLLAEARVRLNHGEPEAAAECCRKLLSLDRLNPVAHFYYALIADLQGERASCEQALRRAIYLDRNFAQAHYHLGLLLQRNHDVRGAQQSYRNVLALLRRRDDEEIFADADGLTVGALRQLTEMQLEVLNRT